MKKKQTVVDYSNSAIERVEKLFPEKKEASRSKNSPIVSFSHVCNFFKLPRVLSTMELISRKKSKKALKNPSKLNKSELRKDALQTHHCCANQKDLLVSSGNYFESTLSPGRVRTWRLKEYILASKKLKKMKHENKKSVSSHQVTLIEKKNPQRDEDKKKSDDWQNFIKQKEERQFRITRITKMLVD